MTYGSDSECATHYTTAPYYLLHYQSVDDHDTLTLVQLFELLIVNTFFCSNDELRTSQ